MWLLRVILFTISYIVSPVVEPLLPAGDCAEFRHPDRCGFDDDDALCPPLDPFGSCPCHHFGCIAQGYVPAPDAWTRCNRYREPGACGLDDDDGRTRCGPIGYFDSMLSWFGGPCEKPEEDCLGYVRKPPGSWRKTLWVAARRLWTRPYPQRNASVCYPSRQTPREVARDLQHRKNEEYLRTLDK